VAVASRFTALAASFHALPSRCCKHGQRNRATTNFRCNYPDGPALSAANLSTRHVRSRHWYTGSLYPWHHLTHCIPGKKFTFRNKWDVSAFGVNSDPRKRSVPKFRCGGKDAISEISQLGGSGFPAENNTPTSDIFELS